MNKMNITNLNIRNLFKNNPAFFRDMNFIDSLLKKDAENINSIELDLETLREKILTEIINGPQQQDLIRIHRHYRMIACGAVILLYLYFLI